ncbi:F-box protein dre-1 [Diplonema papillatum]|nr:F-box protein dre-1 [Diplonema papillatum]
MAARDADSFGETWSEYRKQRVRVLRVGSNHGYFKTIGKALSVADDGDRIEVAGGKYVESIVVKKEVEIVSTDGETPELAYRGTVVSFICPGSPVFAGIELIQHDRTKAHATITVMEGTPKIVDCTFPSIMVSGSAAPSVFNNTITGALMTSGVRIRAKAGGLYRRNRIHTHDEYCVEIDSAGQIVFEDNRMWTPDVPDAAAMAGGGGVALNPNRATPALVPTSGLAPHFNPLREKGRGRGVVCVGAKRTGSACQPVFTGNYISDAGEVCIGHAPPFCAGAPEGRAAVLFSSECCGTFEHNFVVGGATGIRLGTGTSVAVRDNTVSKQDQYGVLCEAACAIERNKFADCFGAAVFTDADATIEGNTISGGVTGHGIVVAPHAAPTVQRNKIEGVSKVGIKVQAHGAGLVFKNEITACEGPAILLEAHSTAAVRENLIAGGAMQGIVAVKGCSAEIADNEILQTKGAGIAVLSVANPAVSGNRVRYCEEGISVSANGRGVFERNALAENKIGIAVSRFSRPTFRENDVQTSTEHGVLVTDNAFGRFEANTVSKGGGNGVTVTQGADPVFAGNTVHKNAGFGVEVVDRAFGTFTGNDIQGSGGANVRVVAGAHPSFRKNRVTGVNGGGDGILVEDGGRGVFEKNAVARNGRGAVVRHPGTSPSFASNSFDENAVYGAWVGDEAGGVFDRNAFQASGEAGLFVTGRAACVLTRNAFKETASHSVVVTGKSSPAVLRNRFEDGVVAGVLVQEASTPEVAENVFERMRAECLKLESGAAGIIRDNTFRASGVGLAVAGGAAPVATGNAFSACTVAGVRLGGAGAGRFEANTLAGNAVGLLVDCPAGGAAVVKNVFEGNEVAVKCARGPRSSAGGAGEEAGGWVRVDDNEILASKATNVVVQNGGSVSMTGNRISNAPVGVLFQTKGVGKMERNDVRGNTECNIRILTWADPTLKENSIQFSVIGVEVSDDGQGILTSNDIRNNGVQLRVLHGGNPKVNGCSMGNSSGSGMVIKERGLGLYYANTLNNNKHSGLEIERDANPTIRGNILSGNQMHGILMHPGAMGVIEDNTMEHNAQSGILVRRAAHPTVVKNRLRCNGTGLTLEEGGGGRIVQNSFSKNKVFGLVAEGRGELVVEDNDFSFERIGIDARPWSEAKFTGNTLGNCRVGLHVGSKASCVVTKNEFTACVQGAVVMQDGAPTFENNKFADNAIGIHVHTAASPRVTNNTFTRTDPPSSPAGKPSALSQLNTETGVFSPSVHGLSSAAKGGPDQSVGVKLEGWGLYTKNTFTNLEHGMYCMASAAHLVSTGAHAMSSMLGFSINTTTPMAPPVLQREADPPPASPTAGYLAAGPGVENWSFGAKSDATSEGIEQAGSTGGSPAQGRRASLRPRGGARRLSKAAAGGDQKKQSSAGGAGALSSSRKSDESEAPSPRASPNRRVPPPDAGGKAHSGRSPGRDPAPTAPRQEEPAPAPRNPEEAPPGPPGEAAEHAATPPEEPVLNTPGSRGVVLSNRFHGNSYGVTVIQRMLPAVAILENIFAANRAAGLLCRAEANPVCRSNFFVKETLACLFEQAGAGDLVENVFEGSPDTAVVIRGQGSNPRVVRCRFSFNGGGVSVEDLASPSITECLFEKNEQFGVALKSGSTACVRRCVFALHRRAGPKGAPDFDSEPGSPQTLSRVPSGASFDIETVRRASIWSALESNSPALLPSRKLSAASGGSPRPSLPDVFKPAQASPSALPGVGPRKSSLMLLSKDAHSPPDAAVKSVRIAPESPGINTSFAFGAPPSARTTALSPPRSCGAPTVSSAAGLILARQGSGVVSENYFVRNDVGVSVQSQASGRVCRNTFLHNAVAGVAAVDGGKGAVHHNFFEHNASDTYAGVAAETVFSGNHLSSATAVVAEDNARVSFAENLITGAVRVRRNADPSFRQNVFSASEVVVEAEGMGCFEANTWCRQAESAQAMLHVVSGKPRAFRNVFLACARAVLCHTAGTGHFGENLFVGGRIGIEVLDGGAPYVGPGNFFDHQERAIVTSGPNTRGIFEKCEVSASSVTGVLIECGADPELRAVDVYDCRTGVLVSKRGNGSLLGCSVFDNTLNGVMVEGGCNPRIFGCKVSSSLEAGALQKGDGALGAYDNNTVKHLFSPVNSRRQRSELAKAMPAARKLAADAEKKIAALTAAAAGSHVDGLQSHLDVWGLAFQTILDAGERNSLQSAAGSYEAHAPPISRNSFHRMRRYSLRSSLVYRRRSTVAESPEALPKRAPSWSQARRTSRAAALGTPASPRGAKLPFGDPFGSPQHSTFGALEAEREAPRRTSIDTTSPRVTFTVAAAHPEPVTRPPSSASSPKPPTIPPAPSSLKPDKKEPRADKPAAAPPRPRSPESKVARITSVLRRVGAAKSRGDTTPRASRQQPRTDFTPRPPSRKPKKAKPAGRQQKKKRGLLPKASPGDEAARLMEAAVSDLVRKRTDIGAEEAEEDEEDDEGGPGVPPVVVLEPPSPDLRVEVSEPSSAPDSPAAVAPGAAGGGAASPTTPHNADASFGTLSALTDPSPGAGDHPPQPDGLLNNNAASPQLVPSPVAVLVPDSSGKTVATCAPMALEDRAAGEGTSGKPTGRSHPGSAGGGSALAAAVSPRAPEPTPRYTGESLLEASVATLEPFSLSQPPTPPGTPGEDGGLDDGVDRCADQAGTAGGMVVVPTADFVQRAVVATPLFDRLVAHSAPADIVLSERTPAAGGLQATSAVPAVEVASSLHKAGGTPAAPSRPNEPQRALTNPATVSNGDSSAEAETKRASSGSTGNPGALEGTEAESGRQGANGMQRSQAASLAALAATGESSNETQRVLTNPGAVSNGDSSARNGAEAETNRASRVSTGNPGALNGTGAKADRQQGSNGMQCSQAASVAAEAAADEGRNPPAGGGGGDLRGTGAESGRHRSNEMQRAPAASPAAEAATDNASNPPAGGGGDLRGTGAEPDGGSPVRPGTPSGCAAVPSSGDAVVAAGSCERGHATRSSSEPSRVRSFRDLRGSLSVEIPEMCDTECAAIDQCFVSPDAGGSGTSTPSNSSGQTSRASSPGRGYESADASEDAIDGGISAATPPAAGRGSAGAADAPGDGADGEQTGAGGGNSGPNPPTATGRAFETDRDTADAPSGAARAPDDSQNAAFGGNGAKADPSPADLARSSGEGTSQSAADAANRAGRTAAAGSEQEQGTESGSDDGGSFSVPVTPPVSEAGDAADDATEGRCSELEAKGSLVGDDRLIAQRLAGRTGPLASGQLGHSERAAGRGSESGTRSPSSRDGGVAPPEKVGCEAEAGAGVAAEDCGGARPDSRADVATGNEAPRQQQQQQQQQQQHSSTSDQEACAVAPAVTEMSDVKLAESQRSGVHQQKQQEQQHSSASTTTDQEACAATPAATEMMDNVKLAESQVSGLYHQQQQQSLNSMATDQEACAATPAVTEMSDVKLAESQGSSFHHQQKQQPQQQQHTSDSMATEQEACAATPAATEMSIMNLAESQVSCLYHQQHHSLNSMATDQEACAATRAVTEMSDVKLAESQVSGLHRQQQQQLQQQHQLSSDSMATEQEACAATPAVPEIGDVKQPPTDTSLSIDNAIPAVTEVREAKLGDNEHNLPEAPGEDLQLSEHSLHPVDDGVPQQPEHLLRRSQEARSAAPAVTEMSNMKQHPTNTGLDIDDGASPATPAATETSDVKSAESRGGGLHHQQQQQHQHTLDSAATDQEACSAAPAVTEMSNMKQHPTSLDIDNGAFPAAPAVAETSDVKPAESQGGGHHQQQQHQNKLGKATDQEACSAAPAVAETSDMQPHLAANTCLSIDTEACPATPAVTELSENPAAPEQRQPQQPLHPSMATGSGACPATPAVTELSVAKLNHSRQLAHQHSPDPSLATMHAANPATPAASLVEELKRDVLGDSVSDLLTTMQSHGSPGESSAICMVEAPGVLPETPTAAAWKRTAVSIQQATDPAKPANGQQQQQQQQQLIAGIIDALNRAESTDTLATHSSGSEKTAENGGEDDDEPPQTPPKPACAGGSEVGQDTRHPPPLPLDVSGFGAGPTRAKGPGLKRRGSDGTFGDTVQSIENTQVTTEASGDSLASKPPSFAGLPPSAGNTPKHAVRVLRPSHSHGSLPDDAYGTPVTSARPSPPHCTTPGGPRPWLPHHKQHTPPAGYAASSPATTTGSPSPPSSFSRKASGKPQQKPTFALEESSDPDDAWRAFEGCPPGSTGRAKGRPHWAAAQHPPPPPDQSREDSSSLGDAAQPADVADADGARSCRHLASAEAPRELRKPSLKAAAKPTDTAELGGAARASPQHTGRPSERRPSVTFLMESEVITPACTPRVSNPNGGGGRLPPEGDSAVVSISVQRPDHAGVAGAARLAKSKTPRAVPVSRHASKLSRVSSISRNNSEGNMLSVSYTVSDMSTVSKVDAMNTARALSPEMSELDYGHTLSSTLAHLASSGSSSRGRGSMVSFSQHLAVRQAPPFSNSHANLDASDDFSDLDYSRTNGSEMNCSRMQSLLSSSVYQAFTQDAQRSNSDPIVLPVDSPVALHGSLTNSFRASPALGSDAHDVSIILDGTSLDGDCVPPAAVLHAAGGAGAGPRAKGRLAAKKARHWAAKQRAPHAPAPQPPRLRAPGRVAAGAAGRHPSIPAKAAQHGFPHAAHAPAVPEGGEAREGDAGGGGSDAGWRGLARPSAEGGLPLGRGESSGSRSTTANDSEDTPVRGSRLELRAQARRRARGSEGSFSASESVSDLCSTRKSSGAARRDPAGVPSETDPLLLTDLSPNNTSARRRASREREAAAPLPCSQHDSVLLSPVGSSSSRSPDAASAAEPEASGSNIRRHSRDVRAARLREGSSPPPPENAPDPFASFAAPPQALETGAAAAAPPEPRELHGLSYTAGIGHQPQSRTAQPVHQEEEGGVSYCNAGRRVHGAAAGTHGSEHVFTPPPRLSCMFDSASNIHDRQAAPEHETPTFPPYTRWETDAACGAASPPSANGRGEARPGMPAFFPSKTSTREPRERVDEILQPFPSDPAKRQLSDLPRFRQPGRHAAGKPKQLRGRPQKGLLPFLRSPRLRFGAPAAGGGGATGDAAAAAVASLRTPPVSKWVALWSPAATAPPAAGRVPAPPPLSPPPVSSPYRASPSALLSPRGNTAAWSTATCIQSRRSRPTFLASPESH